MSLFEGNVLAEWAIFILMLALVFMAVAVVVLALRELVIRRKTRLEAVEKLEAGLPVELRLLAGQDGRAKNAGMPRPNVEVDGLLLAQLGWEIRRLRADLDSNSQFLKGMAYSLTICAIIIFFLVLRAFS